MPKCPNCEQAELVPHRNAGKGQYKDYPDLLVCPFCWHKYVERGGKLIRIKSRKGRMKRSAKRW